MGASKSIQLEVIYNTLDEEGEIVYKGESASYSFDGTEGLNSYDDALEYAKDDLLMMNDDVEITRSEFDISDLSDFKADEDDAFDILENLADAEKEHDYDVILAYFNLRGEIDRNDISDSYRGNFNSDEDFVQNLLEDTGDIPSDLPSYIHIDWERTARDIMMDYSEDNGYYFRD